MATAGAPGAESTARVGLNGSMGLFSVLGHSSLDDASDIQWVADLDLTNLDELRALAQPPTGNGGWLAALWQREGPRFVRRLRGAFALALWDERRRTLLLAVDHLGIRRLHYATDHRRTAFASRPTAVLREADIDRSVDLTAIYNYLNFGYIPAPGSAFRHAHRLPPGHLLLVHDSHVTLEQYWDVAFEKRSLHEGETAGQLYHLTEHAVRTAVGGTDSQELGAFLSGGTDSSTVVGLMTAISGAKVKTFSIGFGEERYNELSYAELTANHFGTAHHTHIVTPQEAFKLLPVLVEAYDEPFGNSSAIGTLVCAELARDFGIRMLLAGDGGDEIFGGNERYRTDRIFARYAHMPSIFRRQIFEPILFRLPAGDHGLVRRAQRYVRRASMPNPRRFYSYEFFFAQQVNDLLDPAFCAALDVEAPWNILEGHYARTGTSEELNRLLYLDLKLTIGDNDLLKVTRTCELASVGVRFPLLDLALVDFTGTWPARFKVRGLEKRYLFKKTFAKLLPAATLAKKKHGFGVPTSAWLKGEPEFIALARDTLLSSRCRQRGYFRQGALEHLFQCQQADVTPYYGSILWTVLMLELWHQRHVDPVAA